MTEEFLEGSLAFEPFTTSLSLFIKKPPRVLSQAVHIPPSPSESHPVPPLLLLFLFFSFYKALSTRNPISPPFFSL
jgi:hypothetical protein